MLTDKFINENFLDPKEKNYNILLKNIESILKISSENISTESPIKHKKIKLINKSISNEINEIPLLSSSTEKIIEKIAEIFEGRVRWNSPYALLNIAPAPLLVTVAATTVASLYNQNALWDFTSGDIIFFEKKVIKALTELIGWDFKLSEGLSTYGGKATLLYAIKIGLHKFNIDIINEGIKKEYFVIASDRAHYSIPDICNYLGIGSANFIQINTDTKGKMILSDFYKKTEKLLKDDKTIVCIILNAGTTIDMCIDPIFEIRKIVNILFEKYKKEKMPHIHADSVAGWAWLFFKDININKLDMKINPKKILTIYKSISQIAHADSFSADFHKTGLSPYCSTFFIVKNHQDIYSLTKHGESNLKNLNNFGDFHVHHFSLENSRSSLGIVSAYVALQKLGWTGFQHYLIKMLAIGNLFRKIILDSYNMYIHIINSNTNGFETLIKINFFADKKSWNEILLLSIDEKNTYINICLKFKDFIYNKIFNELQDLPLIGFVPFYKIQSIDEPLPCYLIYPMSLFTTEKDIINILDSLISLKYKFESNMDNLVVSNVSNLSTPPR